MREDNVRVLRLVEYVGPRSAVEEQVRRSIHGERHLWLGKGEGIVIRAVTLGEFPEIMSRAEDAGTS